MFDFISSGMKIASVIQIFGLVIFAFVFLSVAFVFCKQIRHSQKNKKQPISLEDVIVISKRTHTLQHRMGNSMAYRDVTHYYITFQFQDGNREEFIVSGSDYGMIAENDIGKLKYQGTDFISFNRV